MTLHVHRCSRAENLLGALIGVIDADDAVDPFVPEVIAVPSRGIERWIAQEVSQRLGTSPNRHDGIAANLLFPSPAQLITAAISSADGQSVDLQRPRAQDDPWAPSRLVWTLLDVLPTAGDLGAFADHLHGESGLRRRLPVLLQVAGLFNRYALDRPEMIRAWAANPAGSAPDTDANGEPLPGRAHWQPRLWRAAREKLGPSLAEQVADARAQLSGHKVEGLPHRLSVYGLTALPTAHAEVLEALAGPHDVHLFLLHPSPALWSAVAPTADGFASATPRTDDPTQDTTTHPLLTSWARDSRELQLVLAGRGVDHSHDDQNTDEAPNLLTRLQHDVRNDTDLTATPAHLLQKDDTTVQIHGAHGRTRQVEVLRDVVLGLLDDDPTLQPRDIVVMCPDVETYAPLISAVFGAHGGTGDRTDLRVRMADRALRKVNPCLRVLDDLLHLPDSRVEASRAVDLLRQAPVMARFALNPGDVETIETWVEELDIRWGLHADHRTAHDVPADAGTWSTGLRRLLLGVAVAEEGPRLIGDILPFDDVEGTITTVAGAMAEYVDRLELLVTHLADPRPITQWCADLRATAEIFCAAPGEHSWQMVQLHRLIDDLDADAGGDDAPVTNVTLSELRRLLGGQLQGRPSRENHRTGDLTVCTLVPMRSVPYKVVCLLGLDDGAFPRQPIRQGDDLIATAPHVGDHDPRTEDRQLLLDAVMAARKHLVITYASHDERTGAPKPPCVPVAELLDVLDATAETPDGKKAREHLVTHHPLAATDPRAFDATKPFSFDTLALDGAKAGTNPTAPPAFLDNLPGPADPPGTVEWGDLVRFCRQPIATYLERRLGVRYRSEVTGDGDLLEVELDGLETYDVGSRLLDAALRDDLDDWERAEQARGTLPAGQLGEVVLADIMSTLDAIRDEVATTGINPKVLTEDRTDRVLFDLPVDLDDTTVRLRGAVERVGANALVHADFGKPKPKRLLKLWLDWLALQAAGEGREAILVCQGQKRGSGRNARIEEIVTCYPAVLSKDEAMKRLSVLIGLYRAGLDQPLLLTEACSGNYAKGIPDVGTEAQREKLLKSVAKDWSGFNFNTKQTYGDGHGQHLTRVFGNLSFEGMLEVEPLDDVDVVPRSYSWFEDLAVALWAPVYADRAGVTT